MSDEISDGSTGREKMSKRSSNSYNVEEWKMHRPLITRLYFEEGRTLKDVREFLEKEYNFAPTERMYKSRLHSWGLDKKKKEHEMLDLVRQGLSQKGDDKDKVFLVRGRQVTLADALHYFNRKGIKDPASLLESGALDQGQFEPSSPEDYDNKTKAQTTPRPNQLDVGNAIDGEYDKSRSPLSSDGQMPSLATNQTRSDFAEKQLQLLQQYLNITEWQPFNKYEHTVTKTTIESRPGTALEGKYFEAILAQAKKYYQRIFTARCLTAGGVDWSSRSDESLADRFYYSMYHGYASLWNGQREKAFEEFHKAFYMVQSLLREEHVGFLVYVFDIIIRYEGSGHEEPLDRLFVTISEMAEALFGKQHPMYLIMSWLSQPEGPISRAWVAEFTMRELLSFFSDCIGYFHPQTIALLQAFATSLLNGRHFREAAVRYHQLVDAFETTNSGQPYEVCYALRAMSEAYFHSQMYVEALHTLKLSLDRSLALSHEEEREIHVRCMRGIAEIWNALGRRDEAQLCIQYVVDCCSETFGPDHAFTARAISHRNSIQKGVQSNDLTIPPMIYRLGRGGAAAKWIWVSRTSQLRLVA